MEVSLSPEMLWAIILGAVTVAVSYGGLLMRVVANAKRITEVEGRMSQEISVLRIGINDLADRAAEHRVETTDRLARIEAKLDTLVVGRK